MKAYPEYKSSGIDWLGEIPSHWEKCAFKYFLTQISDVSTSNNKVGLENIESGTGQFNATNSLFEGNGIDFKKGDILYGKLRPYLRKVWIAEFDGNAVGDFFVYRVQKNATEKYVKWLFLSNGFTEIANSSTDGAKMPRVSSDFIRNLEYYLPPLCEQMAIAEYLDEVTWKVDALIVEKRAQVEDLLAYRTSLITETVTHGLNSDAPLRSSGIDWLGDIPEHWETSKIKYIGEIHGRIGYRGYTTEDLVEEGQGAYVIGGKHISKNILDLSSPDFISWEKYYESPEIMIKRGDIVIAQRGTLKRAAIIRDEIGCATINPSLALLNNISVNAIFLHYYLCSNAVTKFIDYLNTQTAVPMISQNQIENIHVVIPPLSEQQAIADFLDEKTEKIDALIDELSKQLDELAEYKKAVISETVTGKVDVRNWTPKS